ncbi:MAG: hypothetical protein Q7R33_05195 [Nitrosarchaeum sp.]|nr:hypothetical protein [Nitrosarchaeum sp.]
MKYMVTANCRLVDRNEYLNAGTVFDPKDENYERTSRSLAAAMRGLWVHKMSDEEIKKYESGTTVVKQEVKPEVKPEALKAIAANAAAKAAMAKAPVTVIDDVQPEAMADEVTASVDSIVTARDKRRDDQQVKPVQPPITERSSVTEEAQKIKGAIRRKMTIKSRKS